MAVEQPTVKANPGNNLKPLVKKPRPELQPPAAAKSESPPPVEEVAATQVPEDEDDDEDEEDGDDNEALVTHGSETPVTQPTPPTPPAKKELPKPVTFEDAERFLEERIRLHLEFVGVNPPEYMDVKMFMDEFPDIGTNARLVLEDYKNRGWLDYVFVRSAGRYWLTDAGRGHLASLIEKLD